MTYQKSNTRLTKEINGRTVQIILTVDGEHSGDWHPREAIAIREQLDLGYEKVKR